MSAFPAIFRQLDGVGNNMMWAGRPDHPGCVYLVNGEFPMPVHNRPVARAVAITAEESRRRLFLVLAANCVLAASLVAGLATAAIWL
jgi:hypothetical protein